MSPSLSLVGGGHNSCIAKHSKYDPMPLLSLKYYFKTRGLNKDNSKPETICLYEWIITPFHSGCLQTGTMANSEDPDKMPLNASIFQSLHCFQR